ITYSASLGLPRSTTVSPASYERRSPSFRMFSRSCRVTSANRGIASSAEIPTLSSSISRASYRTAAPAVTRASGGRWRVREPLAEVMPDPLEDVRRELLAEHAREEARTRLLHLPEELRPLLWRHGEDRRLELLL